MDRRGVRRERHAILKWDRGREVVSKEQRLVQANSVLPTFTFRGVVLELDSTGHVVVCWTSAHKPALVRKRWVTRGSDFHPTWRYPWGGTQSTAIAQLVRWVQGKPTLPLGSWEYWASDTVKLCGPETLEALRAINWPAKPICVLCGNECAGLDWWNLDGVSGPCCSAWKVTSCRFVRDPPTQWHTSTLEPPQSS